MCSQIWLSCGAEFSLELKLFLKFYQWRVRNKCNWCGFLLASIFRMTVSGGLGKSHSPQPFLLPNWFKKRAEEAIQRAEQFTFLPVFRSTVFSPWLPRTDVALLCLYFLHWQNATIFSVAGDRQETFFPCWEKKY